MTKPKRDDAAIWELYNYASSHPENWDQSSWRSTTTACGTKYCLAGFKAWVLDQKDPVYLSENSTSSITNYVLHEGQELFVANYAAEVLGLNAKESTALFFSSNETAEEAVFNVTSDFYR